MGELNELYRNSGLPKARRTQETLRQQAAVDMAIDITGKVNPAALPSSTPLALSWGPSDTRRIATSRAGTVVMLRAFATTAPSTGDAVITLTSTTETGGTETLATVRIPNSTQFSDADSIVGLPVPVPAGAWLYASVTSANGASGVSIGCTIEIVR